MKHAYYIAIIAPSKDYFRTGNFLAPHTVYTDRERAEHLAKFMRTQEVWKDFTIEVEEVELIDY